MFKRKKNQTSDDHQGEDKSGLFARLKSGLAKTRGSFTEGLARLVAGKKQIDDELLEELETLLIIEAITDRVRRRDLTDPEAVVGAVREHLIATLSVDAPELDWQPGTDNRVVLVVGVNGVGKTTTIGKLASRYQDEGLSVMLAAGDTFRAAAVEQLQQWGERVDAPVIAQDTGADSASVVHDAVQAAASRDTDVLLADTAGRLHTKANLMEELAKVRRVVNRLDADAPHETGQNALAQAEKFHEAVPLTGLIVTKLDGTAKGGITVALTQKLGLPIRYIGVGERPEDLRPFDPEAFVDALLDTEE
ncbi:MAG: signal recognition particle-docking protein FtsY [Thiohalorhabdaceae bacterium]